MATYNLYAAGTAIAQWEDVLDPFTSAVGTPTASEIILLNEDGSHTILYSSAGDPFTYDMIGDITGGTVEAIEYTDATDTTVYADMTGLSVAIFDLYNELTFFGLTAAMADADTTWPDVLQDDFSDQTHWISSTSTLTIVSNTDSTFTYIRGTGFTYDGSGAPTGGNITDVERWDNATETGVPLVSVSGLSLDYGDFSDYVDEGPIGTVKLFLNGNDTIISNDEDENISVFGSAGDDNITGSDGTNKEFLFGGGGDDVITGRSGNNLYFGYDGADTFTGQAGHNTINFETIRYDRDASQGGTGAVTVDFSLGQATDGFGNTDTFTDIEAARGTALADVFIGGTDFNRFQGSAGEDEFDGSLGTKDEVDYRFDVNYGGAAAVMINMDITDYVDASFGLNLIAESATDGFGDTDDLIGIERARGTEEADVIVGTDAYNRIRGEGGDDYLIGLDGDDLIEGGNGADLLNGGLGADDLQGGDGDDGVDYSQATAGVTANLTSGTGTAGEATGDTFDSIEGFIGSAFLDRLTGDANANTIYGEDGNDIIRGQGGADELFGDDGDDYIYFDVDDTVVDGGAGYDRVFVDNTSQGVTIADMAASGIEYAKGANWHDTFDATNVTEAVKLWGNGRDDTLTGSAFNDYLNGGSGNDIITGNAGVDTIDGHTGADMMSGGAGNDTFYIDDDDTLIDGGADYDRIFVRGYSDGVDIDITAGNLEFANGNLRNDSFDATGSTVAVKLQGQKGDDVLTGGDVADQLYGGLGDDNISGGAGNDYLNGASGVDTIDGGDGVDRIKGYDGADILNGGAGDDFLYGGADADIFVFDAGWDFDRLVDWEDGSDSIDMSSLSIGFGDLAISQVGAHTDIDYGGDTIRVLNTVVADFDATDFDFV